jgi:hypothetical protein
LKIKVTLINVAIVAMSLMFVLQIRYYTYHGIIPNIKSLFDRGIEYEYIFTGLNYAFSFSLMGTAYVLENFTHDAYLFFLNVNPLPSRYVDLSYLLVNQEMMKTAPISAVSMLGLSGFFGVFVFYFITGYLFNYILTTMKSRTVLYYIPLGLFVMFTLFFYSVQFKRRF